MWREALIKSMWVGLGGFLGANARFWLGTWIQARLGHRLPWATLVINVSGAFLLGFLMAALTERWKLPRAPELRLLLAVGFLGAYTTFSTFEHETYILVTAGAPLRALTYVLASVVAGYAAVWLGVVLGRG